MRDYFGTPETWDTTVALDRIIAAQNSWLAGLNHRRQPAYGMTTLTALVMRGHGYALAHVGDPRRELVVGRDRGRDALRAIGRELSVDERMDVGVGRRSGARRAHRRDRPIT